MPTSIVEVDSISGDSTTIILTEKYINQFKKTDKVRFEMLHQKNRRTEGEIIGNDYVPKAEAPIDGE